MLYKTAWNIVADGTLFKGAFVLKASSEQDAIEKTKAALGAEGRAANVTVKSWHETAIELGRSEYPADGSSSTSVPHVSTPFNFSREQMFAFDLVARANIISQDEESALKKLGHALLGKEVGAVKYMKHRVVSSEPFDSMSQYERHLLEKNFRGIRVSSTG